ncbi:MAG: hypothetical protein ABJA94_08920 [Rhodoglobus sp.]
MTHRYDGVTTWRLTGLMNRTSRLAPATIVIAAMALLTGCGGGSAPHPTPPPTGSVGSAGPALSPAPTLSSTAGASATPLTANALFRITATATEPDGAVAELTETVYAPVALSAAESALLTAQCPGSGWPGNYPSPTAVRATVVTAVRAGSTPWTSFSPVGITASLGNVAAWSGQFAPTANLGCASPGALAVPGTASGVEAISPASSPAGVAGGEGWFSAIYGFAMSYDGEDPAGPVPAMRVTLSNCALELGPLAISGNPATAGWPSEAQLAVQTSCWFGVTG